MHVGSILRMRLYCLWGGADYVYSTYVYTRPVSQMRRLKRVKLLWVFVLLSVLLAPVLVYMANGGDREKAFNNISIVQRAREAFTEKGGRARSPATITRQPVSELQRGEEPAHRTRPKLQETSEMIHCLMQKREIPWLKPKRKFPETYLVFYGKPIMQALWAIGSSRGWKMKHIPKDTSEGLSELKELVSPERFLVVLTVSRVYHHAFIMNLANSTNALIGTVGNAAKVTGSKQAQLTSFRRYFQLYGCSLEESGIMPLSFILDDTKECIRFFRYSSTQPKSWWILKPSSGQGGDGITIHSNLTFFYKEFATCAKESNSIVQEYVTNPLLLEKRKFDIRAYILVAKTFPHYLAFYHEGYLRRSVKEFDVHGSRDVHLTNSHVQTLVEGYLPDSHIWSFQNFQDYLNEHRPEDTESFVFNRLSPFIQKVGLFIVHTGK